MWSDRYCYYNIQCDEQFSQRHKQKTVIDCLLETRLFRQTDNQSFANTHQFPWVDITLVETYDGNFASSDEEHQFVTQIVIVTSKGKDTEQQLYTDTFRQIAAKLQWKLYLEEDDDGNEMIEI